MSKHDRLSKSLNRAWIQRSNKFSENNMQEVKRLLVEASSISRMIEILEDMRNATNRSSYDYNTLVPYLNSIRHVNDKYLRNDIRRTNEGNRATNAGRPMMKVEREYLDNEGDSSSLRIDRKGDTDNRKTKYDRRERRAAKQWYSRALQPYCR